LAARSREAVDDDVEAGADEQTGHHHGDVSERHGAPRDWLG